ncbi:hypothetical protein [Mycolicibacter sinensis]|uniref:Uncharacterized protein n=1 Tax=Mycolicibacter sinensis (strain JDM601) TaxID=875328 RepID=A0A1A2XTI2_MYCSD|nr:hypothetical protein [Mycolicibacter sinensis]OBI29049.1 hypothetical protein A5710_22620 [Mycolicibacter sinensis]
MIQLTITAQASTVAEALAHLRTIVASFEDLNSRGLRGGAVILDGIARPVTKGATTIGSLAAEGNAADKLAHYTSKDRTA